MTRSLNVVLREILRKQLNDQKPYFGAKMTILLPKKGPKRVKNFDVRIPKSFIH